MSTNLLNGENILRKVYDPPTQSLKTNVTAIVPPGTITVAISDVDDSIKIGDGSGTYLDINPDGSINVVVSDTGGLTTENIFNEISSVASGVSTTILSYLTVADTKFQMADVSGTNIAMYTIFIDGVLQAKRYTYFQSLSESFNFGDGVSVPSGKIIEIKVLHNRPDVGDFASNIVIRK